MWDKVMALMEKGVPPSRIDKALFLKEGTAHDMIVDGWACDKVIAEMGKWGGRKKGEK